MAKQSTFQIIRGCLFWPKFDAHKRQEVEGVIFDPGSQHKSTQHTELPVITCNYTLLIEKSDLTLDSSNFSHLVYKFSKSRCEDQN